MSINDIIEILINDVAWQTDDGCPNWQNKKHVNILENTLRSYEIDENVIAEIITNLREASDNWWEEMSPEQQSQYLKDHPKSAKVKEIEKQKASVNNQTVPDKKIIDGKDKSLRDVNTIKTEAFTSDLVPSAEEFDKRNKNYQNPTPPPPLNFASVFDSIDIKFPRKYISALERMINTIPKGDAIKWSHYSDMPAGAGTISSQAGEILSMVLMTLDDKTADMVTAHISGYQNELLSKYPKIFNKDKTGRVNTMSLDPLWVKSAVNNRKSILNRIKKQYGPDAEISAAAWDTKDDVTALGLNDYDINKGFSTDFYVKIKHHDKYELDEISLKQSLVANFLNSGTGILTKHDTSLIGSNVDVTEFNKNQRKRLISAVEEYGDDIRKLLKDPKAAKNVLAIMKNKKIGSIDDTLAKAGKLRDKNKVIYYAMVDLAASGNMGAKKWVEEHMKHDVEYVKNVYKEISENKKLKAGILNDVKESLPLKSLMSGEESMALGEFSLDKFTCKSIFGTDDYEELKSNLYTVTDKNGKTYLLYKAEIGGREFRVANMTIRQNGRGYGLDMKFELSLHTDFKNQIRDAQAKVYGDK